MNILSNYYNYRIFCYVRALSNYDNYFLIYGTNNSLESSILKFQIALQKFLLEFYKSIIS